MRSSATKNLNKEVFDRQLLKKEVDKGTPCLPQNRDIKEDDKVHVHCTHFQLIATLITEAIRFLFQTHQSNKISA